jgi:pimeloyl-ACP methyl ester carboxylesterase
MRTVTQPRMTPALGSTPPPEEPVWTDVDGLAIHARRWRPAAAGGPPVVLVHGLGVASRMCQPAARWLARHHDVWAPDLPGFGESDKPGRTLDIDELGQSLSRWMAAVGIDGAVLVGTSIGSQIAAAAADQDPASCASLVLASPTVDWERRRWRSQLWRWQVEQSTQSARMRGLQLLDYAKCGIPRVIRTFSAAMDDRLEERVRLLRQPILVCWATRDPLVSRRWAGAVAHRASRGRLAVLPGSVHALCHENPLELSRVVGHFLAVNDRLREHPTPA